MAEEQIIISVDIDMGRTEQQLDAVVSQIAELKRRQKELNDEFKDNKASEEYIKQSKAISIELATLQRQQTNLTTALKTAEKTNDDYADSLDGMRAKLNDMQRAYATLSKAQRDSAEGQQFLKAIAEQDRAVKGLEQAIGDARRNVGDYEGALKRAFPAIGKFSDGIDTATKVMQDLGAGGAKAMKGLVSGLGSATKAALKFIATPIGAVLAAVVAAVALMTAGFKKLQEAFKKNDEAGTNWAKLMASFQPILDAVSRAFDWLASSIGRVAAMLADWIGSQSEAAQAAQDLVVAIDNLEQAERDYTVNSAKRNKDISELRAKATQTERYSAEERIAMLREAMELEKKNLEEQKNIAAEKLRILEETAARESDTSDETTNKIAQHRAALYNAEEQYYSGTRRLLAQLNSAEKEIAKEREERMKKRIDEYYAEIRAQQEQMELLRQGLEALQNVEKSREEQRDQILEKYKLKSDDDYYYEELSNLKNYLDQRLINEEEYYKAVDELNKKYAVPEYEEDEEEVFIPAPTIGGKSIEDMVRDTFGLDKEALEYYNELVESGTKTSEAFAKTQEFMAKRNAQAFATAAGAMAGAFNDMSEMLNEYGEENKKAQKAAKAFALAGILASQAQSIAEGALAISSGIAQSQSVPFPANLVSLATTVATITGLITSTVSSFMQAKQLLSGSDAGAFETGGIVGGTSYTGDRLTARVNSGEMILSREQQTSLFNMVNNPTGTGLIDYEALASAMSAMPAPVMDYTEFQQFGQKVATYNEITNI